MLSLLLTIVITLYINISPKGAYNFAVKVYQKFPSRKIGKKAFYVACQLSKKVLKDVMLAEALYKLAVKNTPEEWEASQLCMSFL